MIVHSAIKTLIVIGLLKFSGSDPLSCSCHAQFGSRHHDLCPHSTIDGGVSTGVQPHVHEPSTGGLFGIGAMLTYGLGKLDNMHKKISINKNPHGGLGGRLNYDVHGHTGHSADCGYGHKLLPQVSLTSSTKLGHGHGLLHGHRKLPHLSLTSSSKLGHGHVPGSLSSKLQSTLHRSETPKSGIAIPAHPGRLDHVDLSTKSNCNCKPTKIENGDLMAAFNDERDPIPFDQQEKIYNGHGSQCPDLSAKVDPISLRIALNKQIASLNRRPMQVAGKRIINEDKLSYGPYNVPVDGSVRPGSMPDVPEQQLQTISKPILELKPIQPVVTEEHSPPVVSYSSLGYTPVAPNKTPFIDYSAPPGSVPTISAAFVDEVLPKMPHSAPVLSPSSGQEQEPPCGQLAAPRPGYHSGSVIYSHQHKPPSHELHHESNLRPHSWNVHSSSNFNSCDESDSDVGVKVEEGLCG